jgi:glycosyltransferase involved in cell wall biosynthesis
MPVYNCEAYVGDAIASILSQTFSDFELIIVDDGSTDGTSAIIEKYRVQDERVVVLRKSNGGVISALNVGLQRCRGDYVARMDGDDISAPNRFEAQVRHLDQNPECVCVGGAFTGIDEWGNKSHEVFRYSRNTRTSFDVFPIRVALTLHPLAMFRRATLLGVKGYRSTFTYAEDHDLFLRIAEFGRIDNVDEPCSTIAIIQRVCRAKTLNDRRCRPPMPSLQRYCPTADIEILLGRRWISKRLATLLIRYLRERRQRRM